jgi:hypothetical protein
LSSGVLTSLALAAVLGPDVIARYCLGDLAKLPNQVSGSVG